MIDDRLLIAGASALLGYAIQEYRFRSRPLVQILSFDGAILASKDKVTIDRSTVERSEKCSFCGRVADDTAVGDLHDAIDSTDEISDNANDLIAKLNESNKKLSSSMDDKSIIDSLFEIYSDEFFESFIMKASLRQKLNVPESTLADIKVTIDVIKDHGGCYLIPFSKSQILFGEHLKDYPFIKRELDKIINNIAKLDRDNLIDINNQTIKLLQAEIVLSDSLQPKFKEYINPYYRWGAPSVRISVVLDGLSSKRDGGGDEIADDEVFAGA